MRFGFWGAGCGRFEAGSAPDQVWTFERLGETKRRVGTGVAGLQVPAGQGHPSGLGISTDKLPLCWLGAPTFFLWFSFLISKVPGGGGWGGDAPEATALGYECHWHVSLPQDKAPLPPSSGWYSESLRFTCVCEVVSTPFRICRILVPGSQRDTCV